jgi:carbamoyltransferase
MNVLGIKCSGHDTGAALVTDRSGVLQISAISEARLNRRKHSYTYPLLAIRYVLDRFGFTSLDEMDLVCIDRHGEVWPERYSQFGRLAARRRAPHPYDLDNRFNYLVEQSVRFPRKRVRYINHVDAHAASTYHVSGFDAAAILVIEGGTGFYIGRGTAIDIVDRTGYGGDEYQDGRVTHRAAVSWPRHRRNISNLYDLVTRKLGLDKFAAGKTMALAAFRDRFPIRNYLGVPADRHRGFMTDYRELILRLDREIRPFRPTSMATRDLELVSEYWVNIAREAQETLEADVTYLAGLAARKSGLRKLCLAGGVALSCVTNRKLLDLGLFDELFAQPAASDEGIPLGCALWGYYQIAGGTHRIRMNTAYLGTPPAAARVPHVLDRWGLAGRRVTPKEVAQLLADGRIIGRISGGSEYGPRALGNRSILADPRIENMAEVINTRIKHRERYRPFAPSCHEDKQRRYFDLPCPSPFMLLACAVLPEARTKIPAVVHVDGSSRVQTVTPEQNRRYYELIGEFGEITGIHVLLNTSFNDDGEPIVETYEDALLSFVRTGLDALYIEDYLLERPPAPICQRLRDELTHAIAARVTADYAREIAALCDESEYRRLEASLGAWRPTDSAQALRQYAARAKALALEEGRGGLIERAARRAVNRLGEIARHSPSRAASSTATLTMIGVSLAFEARRRLRH